MSSSSAPAAVSLAAEVEGGVDLSHVSTGSAFINNNLPSYIDLGTRHWPNPSKYFDFNGGLGNQMGCNIPAYYCFAARGGGGGSRGGWGGGRGGGRGGRGRGEGGGGGGHHHRHADPHAAAPSDSSSTHPPSVATPKAALTLDPLNPLVDCSSPSAPNAISGLFMCKMIDALSNPSCNYHPRFLSERDRELLSRDLLTKWGLVGSVEGASYFETVQRVVSDEWSHLMPSSHKGGRGGKHASPSGGAAGGVGPATALINNLRQTLTTVVLFHRLTLRMPSRLIDRTQENTLQKLGSKDPKELFFAVRERAASSLAGGARATHSVEAVLAENAKELGTMFVQMEEPVAPSPPSAAFKVDVFAKVTATIVRQQVQQAEDVLLSSNNAAKAAANATLIEENQRIWTPHCAIMREQVIRVKLMEDEQNDAAEECDDHSDHHGDDGDEDVGMASRAHTGDSTSEATADKKRIKRPRQPKLKRADLAGMTTSALAMAAWAGENHPPRPSAAGGAVDIHSKVMRFHTTYVAPAVCPNRKDAVLLPFEDNKKTKANAFRSAALDGVVMLRKLNDLGAARAELANAIRDVRTRTDLQTPIRDEVLASGLDAFTKAIYAFDVALGGVHTKSGSEHEDTFWVKDLDRLIIQVLIPSSRELSGLPLAVAIDWVKRCQEQTMTAADIAAVAGAPGVVDAAAMFGVIENEDGTSRAAMSDAEIVALYGPGSRGSTALCSAEAPSKRLGVLEAENAARARVNTNELISMNPNQRNSLATSLREQLIRFAAFTHYATHIAELPFLLVVQPSTKFCTGRKDEDGRLVYRPVGEFDGLILRVTCEGAVVHRVLEMKSNLADLVGAAKQRDRLGMALWKAMEKAREGPTDAVKGATDGPPATKEPTLLGAGCGVDDAVTLTVGDVMIQLCPVRDQIVPPFLLRLFPLLQQSFSGLPLSPFAPPPPTNSPPLSPLEAHYRALVRTWVYVSKVVVEPVFVRGKEVWVPSLLPARLVGGGSFRHVICSFAAVLAARDFPQAIKGDWLGDRRLKSVVSSCIYRIRSISVEQTLNAFTLRPHCPQAIVEELRTLRCLENLLLIPSAQLEED